MGQLQYDEQLQKIIANVNEWLKFAEAKNFGLLTLNAGIVFGFSQIDFKDILTIQKAGVYIIILFALPSFISALFSLFPILTKIEKGEYAKGFIRYLSNLIDKETGFVNIHFYGYLKGINETEFETKFLNDTGTEAPFTMFEKELVTQILYNSRITWLKYQLFKIGAFLFLSGIFTFIVAVVLIKVFC